MYKTSNKDIYFRKISKDKLVIFLHGYKGDKDELKFLRDFVLKKLHFSYYCFNYGERNAKNEVININNACVEIEKTINDFLSDHPFKKIYLIGYSFGAGIAVKAAYEKSTKLSGLILISVFDDLKKLLAQRGIKLVGKDDICPEKLVKKIGTPIVFIHGNKDASVSVQRGLAVYKNSDKKESLFITTNSDHYFKDYKSRKELCESVKKALSFISNISN